MEFDNKFSHSLVLHEMPVVNVIVPCYNVAQYLPRVAACLNNQTLKSLEVIWVDDGSPDGTAGLCDMALLASDSPDCVLHTPNGGLAAARNVGLAIACSGKNTQINKYIGFMDPDDDLDPTMYAELLDSILESDAQCAVCGYIEEWLEGDLKNECKPSLIQSKAPYHQCVLESFILGQLGGAYAWNKLYSCQMIVESNVRFPEGVVLTEDAIFWLQVIPHISLLSVVEMTLYHYIRRRDSLCGTVNPNFFEFYLLAYKTEQQAIQHVFGAGGKDLLCKSTRRYLSSVMGYLKRWAHANANPFQVIDKTREIASNNIWQEISGDLSPQLTLYEKLIVKQSIWRISFFLIFLQWLPARIYLMVRYIWRSICGRNTLVSS